MGGPGILTQDEILTLAQKSFTLIDESLDMSNKENKAKALDGPAMENNEEEPPAAMAKQEDDEDASSDLEEMEGRHRRAVLNMLGALMEVGTTEFVQCLPKCGEKIVQWLQSPKNKVLA